MELIPTLFALLGGGCFGFLPILIAVIAIIDAVRVGADWYWILIILFFPVVGSLVYFAVVRAPWSRSRVSHASPASARRTLARKRLRALDLQLSHWRGPAILAEAGDELLVLGRIDEAKERFREALTNGAGADDVNFGLAQALQIRDRFGEAVPFLEELHREDPDDRFGQTQLHLARSLDESGRAEEAEKHLRDLLSRRSIIEAQVRLARLLQQRGESAEAAELQREVAAEAKDLPRYLKRQHRGWIRAARSLSGFPKTRIEGTGRSMGKLLLVLAAAGLLVLLIVLGFFIWSFVAPFAGTQSELIKSIEVSETASRPPEAKKKQVSS